MEFMLDYIAGNTALVSFVAGLGIFAVFIKKSLKVLNIALKLFQSLLVVIQELVELLVVSIDILDALANGKKLKKEKLTILKKEFKDVVVSLGTLKNIRILFKKQNLK